MPADDRRWTGADRDTVAGAIRDAELAGHGCHGQAVAALDALTADGWRPPCAICAKPPTIVCNCPPLMIGDSDAR